MIWDGFRFELPPQSRLDGLCEWCRAEPRGCHGNRCCRCGHVAGMPLSLGTDSLASDLGTDLWRAERLWWVEWRRHEVQMAMPPPISICITES